ncbi:acetyltransferase family protein [Kurthia sp. 11kri321]|uniref:GNAT family N-acetyltransferase n=1 Tax=Kurthia TaxID=1649 RepID=UPI000745C26F|nr:MULTISPECIES: GNAT family N-acetyltransferase [Kurthia]AMA62516.1 acetyltransferase family protein [Kurthia sp. 11kri321]MEB6113694.1 GNAT family N-acetyltransferase [Kurthia gibsonii]
MYIQTERVILRLFKEEDWEAVYAYTSQADVMHYIPEGVFSKEDAKRFVLENKGEKARYFPIIEKSSNQLIGHLFFEPNFGTHTYEIGWVMNPCYTGKGYASEAAEAMIQYGFTELDLHRIVATCQPENIASWRIMEKIGMRKEGLFKQCIPTADGWWDEFYYAILADEYKKSRALE